MSFEAMAWAVKQELPAMQKLVLLLLANRTNADTGQCTPSYDRLAKDCGMTSRSAKAQIAKLADAGYLSVTSRAKEGLSLTNQYTLALGSYGVNDIHPRGNDVHGGREPHSPLGVNHVHPKQEEETNKETGNTYIANPAPKTSDATTAVLASGVNAQVAADWLEVRKGKKSAPTKTAIDDVLESLAEAGYSPADGIKLCAARGWAGFNKKWLVDSQAQQRQQPNRQPAGSSQLGPAGQATAAAAERLIARLTGDSNANQ